MRHFCRLGLLFVAVSFAIAETHSYRYELKTGCNEPRYAAEIPFDSGGPRFDIETDAKGRIVRVSTYENGNKIKETIYHYEGGASRVTDADFYLAGELTTTVRVERNTKGSVVRDDYLTRDGNRTGYFTCEYSGDRVEATSFNLAGKPVDHWTFFFSQDVVVREIHTPDDKTSIEVTYSSNTGQVQSRKQYQNGILTSHNSFTYDSNGSLLREDIYDSNDRWFAAKEYADELRIREIYKFLNGGTQETRTTYDAKRFATEATFSWNDRLICTFKFDRFSNGVLKRTLAVGPNGDLYAEYPDHYVDKVNRNGTALDDIKGTVIYKQGNWW